jgi:hypothetical protein
MADANIRAVITAKDEASPTVAKFGSGINGAGLLAAAGVAAAGAAIVGFGVASVKAFEESERTAAQLDAVLRSTGGAAGVTRDAAVGLSKELEHTTGVSDEAALAAENMLLTFTNIGSDIFPDTTRAVVDMATAMNGGIIPSAEELRQQSIQLGKALQDPDAGLGALHRVGVNVDELKKKFTDSMPIQEKQKLILKELATEFGGSGKAAAQTFGGQIKMLQETFGDLMEDIGQGIVTVIRPLIEWFQYGVNHIEEFGNAIYGYLKTPLELLWGILQTQVIPVFKRLWNEVLVPLAPFLGGVLLGVLQVQLYIWSAVAEAVSIVGRAILYLKDRFVEAYNFLAPIFGPAVQNLVKEFKEELWPALQQLWNTIQTQLMPALKDLWKQVSPVLGPALIVLGAIIGGSLVGALYVLAGVLTGITKAIQVVVSWTASMISWFNEAIKYVHGLADALTGVIIKVAQLGGFGAAISQVTNNVGHRAAGGPVSANTPYVVGENGPELFVPGNSGAIVPNNKLGGSTNNTTVNINVGLMTGSAVEQREAAMKIFNNLKDIASQKGQTVSQMIGAA